MTKRMWITVIIGIIVFLGLTTLLFFNYRNSSQIDATYLNQQLVTLNTQLDNTIKESLGTDNITVIADIKTKIVDVQAKIDQKSGLGSQIWGFFGTDTFKTVGISLILAVILAVIGGILKIDNAIEERVRNNRQKTIDAQSKCIEKTADMWNELFCIISEIRYYDIDRVDSLKKKEDGKNLARTISDIIMSLENFSSKAEDVVNTWQYTFPKLPKITEEILSEKEMDYNRRKATSKTQLKAKTVPKEDLYEATSLILTFVNVLFCVASSVACFIRDNKNKKKGIKVDLPTLQHSLGVIQDVIKDGAHNNILSLLKNSVDSLDSYQPKKYRDEARKNIEIQLDNMYYNAKVLWDIEYKYLPLLIIGSDKNDAFKTESDVYINWFKTLDKITDEEQKGTEIEKKRDELYSVLNKMTGPEHKLIINTWDITFTEQYINELANQLAFRRTRWDLEDRARWLPDKEHYYSKS